jgi:L-threonylcarbamoyladenylate synthase
MMFLWPYFKLVRNTMTKKNELIILNCFKTEDISICVSMIKNGAVVVFPTDTTYGIGCDPYNIDSVQRIFEIKHRDTSNPLPVLAYSYEDVERMVLINNIGKTLAKAFWPGGLTIVAPIRDENIPMLVSANKNNIGIRIPQNRCILSVLSHCKYLVGTSANISGQSACTNPSEVLKSSMHGYDVLLNGGQVEKGVPSTIVELLESTFKIIREGAISSNEIRKLLGHNSESN